MSLLEAEVRKDGTRLMRSRKHLKAVKVEPNAQGNVFHNKELILEKIVGIIEEYKNREKDTL